MAAPTVSAGQASKHINFHSVPRRTLCSLLSTRNALYQEEDTKGFQWKKLPRLMLQKKHNRYTARAKIDSDVNITPPYPSDIIMQYYIAINDKNLEQIKGLLSEDCLFEDYTFPKPFKGKKEVLIFLEQLTASMGQNVEFNVETICEGTGNIATAYWHLDWKKSQIPFTKGCSYFELRNEGERLVIMYHKNIKAHIESPIKPGGLALALLKIVNSLFDAFPEATERFLKSPHVIFQLLLKIYNIFLQPIVKPLLAWYIRLWSLAIGFSGLAFKLLQQITKILHM